MASDKESIVQGAQARERPGGRARPEPKPRVGSE